MENLQLMKLNGRQLVLKASDRRETMLVTGEILPVANFEKTGLALCGVLKDGETLNGFYLRMEKIKQDRKLNINKTIKDVKEKNIS